MSSILGFPASQGAGSGKKFQYHMQALSSFDRVVGINYLDFGTRFERISTVIYSSVLYPDSNLTKTVFYLDVGSINQRIEKIEYQASVFLPDQLRLGFNYTLDGNRYKMNGFNYEFFT